MYKILASFLLLLVIQPVFASNLNTNTFSSKLKMNQPKVTIGAYQNPRRLKYRDCYKCQHHNPYLEDSNLSALEKYDFAKKKIDCALLFEKCNSIHTFFMKSNIDVIMCSKDNTILYYYNNVSKNKIILPKKNVNKTIELPVNYFNIKINDKIRID